MNSLKNTQLKVCGIKSVKEAQDVLEAGADFVGVIFAKSIRQVSIQTAKEISNLAHKYGKKCVGVFASSNLKCEIKNDSFMDKNLTTTSNQIRNLKPLLSYAFGYESGNYEVPEFNSLSQGQISSMHEGQSDCEIMEIVEFCGLDMAQIHGSISEVLYLNLKDLGCDVWQALSVSETLPEVTKFCDFCIYDCKGTNLGGNGTSFNWNLLKNLEPFSFGLAGGIGEENVSEALKFNPKIIDINSKVEDENLNKIPSKVQKISQILNL